MKICTIINVYENLNIVKDTIESVLKYTDNSNILLVISEDVWDQFNKIDNVHKIKGYRSENPKFSYKNMALGLSVAYENFEVDWICYCDQYSLFNSKRYLQNLQIAEKNDIWMMGFCGHIDVCNLKIIEKMIDDSFKSVYSLAYCCQFFHKKFLTKLNNFNFFNQFLQITSSFKDSFPYDKYNINEHLYATLCRHYGGNIGVFSTWDDGKWYGFHEYFPVRNYPEINEYLENASIICPVKNIKIRELYKEARK